MLLIERNRFQESVPFFFTNKLLLKIHRNKKTSVYLHQSVGRNPWIGKAFLHEVLIL